MKPSASTPAHQSPHLAELVCSNSLRADDPATAPGLLKAEMRLAGSVVMEAADINKVPAGGALAVDRESFSRAVEEVVLGHPNVEITHEELGKIPDEPRVIVATGPLTTDDLAADIIERTAADALHFIDATAPIVDADSIDRDVVFEASRYGKGEGGYLNCPLTKEEYERFVSALIAAEKVGFRDFEKPRFFEGCMPVEEMARRGRDTLAYGPMKPVGLVNPRTGDRPYAVVQLRREDRFGGLYNMVGFQTQMTWPEQRRVFRMIPGLENAEFHRLGTLHRNTFIRSPVLLDERLRLKKEPGIRFAGQITGVEGYIESAATGWLAGLFAAAEAFEVRCSPPPPETAHGCLIRHLTESEPHRFQPMNINFCLMPPLRQRVPKKARKAAYRDRALAAFSLWYEGVRSSLPPNP